MLITKGQSRISLPDDWAQPDEKNPDYFESPDEARGIYVTSHEKNDLDTDRKVLDFVQRMELDKTRGMKGYKFRSYANSKSSASGAVIGYLDQYAEDKNYRIVSKCIVKQGKIFRAVLHDYDCGDYEVSKRQFNSILDSFAYFPKYVWASAGVGESVYTNEAKVLKEDGFVDIDLFVASHTENRDGSFLINAANTLEGKSIGFSIQLDKNWTPKKIEGSQSSFYWGTGKFISSGQPTDDFIEVLSRYYGVSVPPISKREIEVVIVGLANDPRQLSEKETKMKVFFNSDNQELYSEVFINVNLTERTIEFHEKDQEYRQSLVRSMSGEI